MVIKLRKNLKKLIFLPYLLKYIFNILIILFTKFNTNGLFLSPYLI